MWGALCSVSFQDSKRQVLSNFGQCSQVFTLQITIAKDIMVRNVRLQYQILEALHSAGVRSAQRSFEL